MTMMISWSLRILIMVFGASLMFFTFTMYAKRKITDNIALSWMAFSLVLILAGAINAWAGWSTRLAAGSYIMLFLIGGLVVVLLFRVSIYLSTLLMKNQELSMHVSLLNQENEVLLKEIKKIKRELHLDDEEEPTINN